MKKLILYFFNVILFILAILTVVFGSVYIIKNIASVINFVNIYPDLFENGLVVEELYSYIINPIIANTVLSSGILFSVLYIVFNIKNGFAKNIYSFCELGYQDFKQIYKLHKNEKQKEKLVKTRQKLQEKINQIDERQSDE